MERKKPTHSYQPYFEDICLGTQRIRKTGGCYVITVPKAIVEQLKLRKDDSVLPILIVRRKKFHGELQEGEEWIKMSKREMIMFEQWLSNRKEEQKEHMEESIDWNI